MKLSVSRSAKGAAIALLTTTLAPNVWSAPKKAALPSTGRISYKLSSSMFSGTMRLSWANGGTKYRQETAMKMQSRPGGAPMTVNSWSIYDGKYIYTASPMFGPKTAMRMKISPEMSRSMMLSTLNTSPKGLGGKVVGRGQVLGKPCEIRQSTFSNQQISVQSKLWMWQNLPLRVESIVNMKGEAPKNSSVPRQMRTTLVATNVQTGVKLSPSLFVLPSGYKVQDMKMPANGRMRPGR